MELIKGQQPVEDERKQTEILRSIFNERIELFDLTDDTVKVGKVNQISNGGSFNFSDDTKGDVSKWYNLNDVQIKAN